MVAKATKSAFAAFLTALSAYVPSLVLLPPQDIQMMLAAQVHLGTKNMNYQARGMQRGQSVTLPIFRWRSACRIAAFTALN